MESFYTLLSALKGQQRQMEAVSNNLANINTPGFKKDQVLFREFYTQFVGQDLESEEEKFAHKEYISPFDRGGASFVIPDHVSPSMTKGRFSDTGNAYDLAIQSDGFFTVQTPNGLRYTRNGQFMRGGDGFLITNNGDKLLGNKGPIQIKGKDFSVGQDGTVLVDQQEVDVLKIVNFNEPERLTKFGNSYWAPSSDKQQPLPPKDIIIQQGVIEGSNVDSVEEMVKMIQINRSYEAAQRMVRSLDDLDEKIISIARV